MSKLKERVAKELSLPECFTFIDGVTGVDLTNFHSDEPISEERTKALVRTQTL
jgi:hypothetical protein